MKDVREAILLGTRGAADMHATFGIRERIEQRVGVGQPAPVGGPWLGEAIGQALRGRVIHGRDQHRRCAAR